MSQVKKKKKKSAAFDPNLYTTLIAPLLTEKTSKLIPEGKYVFWVKKCANKIEIKKAVEKTYNVKVKRIASSIVKGRTKRLRWNQPGKTTAWKKAVITLQKGQEIKIT